MNIRPFMGSISALEVFNSPNIDGTTTTTIPTALRSLVIKNQMIRDSEEVPAAKKLKYM